MPKIHIAKSIQINAPINEVYDAISTFNPWVEWSPWLILEPGVKVDISDQGKFYTWEGNRTGSGHMKMTGEEKNKSVDIDLTFLKPWKTSSKVRFELTKKDNSTNVTWFMDGSLPFFMFWMKKMTETFVGMDYDRGLALLKDYVEDGEVHSKLNFLGESQYGGTKYVGIITNTNKMEMGHKMQADFGRLMQEFGKSQESNQAESFSIYHKFDPVKDKIQYTAAMPVTNIPQNLPTGVISGEIPASKVYTLEHIGPYEHLGNAWTTLQMMIRGKEIKTIKNIHPWETYHNNPADTNLNDLITRIHFAVK